MNLKGKSILLVLFIILISSILINLLFMVKHSNAKAEGVFVKSILHNSNIISIGRFYSLNYTSELITKHNIEGLSLKIKKWHHGLLNYTNCQSVIGDDTLSYSVCTANAYQSKSIIELRNSPHNLRLHGSCYLNGNIYVPNGMLHKKVQNKISTIYTHNGLLLRSKEFPQISESVQKQFQKIINYPSQLNHIYSHEVDNQSIVPFDNETVTFDETFFTNRSTIVGNAIFISKDTLYINKTINTEGAIFIASTIIIEEGFSGNGQFFAKDEIIVENYSYLGYPSIIAVPNTGKISIEENVTLNGNIYSINIYKDLPNHDITIDNGFELNGIIYTMGSININQAIIHGTLYAYSLNAIHDNNADRNLIGDLEINYSSKKQTHPLFSHFVETEQIIIREYSF